MKFFKAIFESQYIRIGVCLAVGPKLSAATYSATTSTARRCYSAGFAIGPGNDYKSESYHLETREPGQHTPREGGSWIWIRRINPTSDPLVNRLNVT